MFATPKRHILARNRVFRHILRQNPSRSLGCSELQPPSPKKTFWVCNLACKVTHARKGNPWANRDELLHRCRGPRRNHLCQFLWFPSTGFERRGGQILGFPLTCIVALTTLSHYRASVWSGIDWLEAIRCSSFKISSIWFCASLSGEQRRMYRPGCLGNHVSVHDYDIPFARWILEMSKTSRKCSTKKWHEYLVLSSVILT